MIKNIAVSLVFIFSVTCAVAKPPEAPKLIPTKVQSQTIVDVIAQLNARHYRNQAIDDSLSTRFLESYIDSLDPAHMFFYTKDVENLKKHSLKYDDYFRKGKLEEGFEVYRTYRARVVSRLESAIEMLADENVKFDFNAKDEIILDRSELPWPTTQAEADELWYMRTKLSLLNLKLAGKTLEEAKETVTKRYKNQLNRILQQDSADVFEIMVNSLTLLFDPHTNYWSPRTSENFNINMSLSLEGIGAVLQSEDEFTKVVSLVPGGPASKQGQLKPADRIVGVGQGDEGEVVDVTGWRLDEVVDRIRGPKNTVVRLEVLPAKESNGETAIIRIKRDEVKLEDQAAKKGVLELSDEERLYKIGVINLPAFYINFDKANSRDPDYRSSTRDVSRLLDELQAEGVDGIILDLRNNGGGSLREATMLTDLFIDHGTVVQIRTPDGYIARHNHARLRAKYRGPLIVLVNRLSASASEIFAGAIQDYDRGLIVGTQTFGKGTVQSVAPTVEGKIKLTESKFYRVSGDSTQHRGIIPDIELPMLVDMKEVGESAYDNALPWDTIHPVPHAKYFDLDASIPYLTEAHKKRIAHDPDFNYLLDQIAVMEENKRKKAVSLNEKQRIAEKENLEKQAMVIENKRRTGKGQDPYKTLAEYRAAQEEENPEDAPVVSSRETVIDLDGDTLLNESGNILIDYIRFQTTNAQKQASNFSK